MTVYVLPRARPAMLVTDTGDLMGAMCCLHYKLLRAQGGHGSSDRVGDRIDRLPVAAATAWPLKWADEKEGSLVHPGQTMPPG